MKNRSILYYFWSGAIVFSLVLVLFALLFVTFSKGTGEDGSVENTGAGSVSQPGESPGETAPPTGETAPPTGETPATATATPNPTKLQESEDMGQEYLDKFVFLGDSTTYGLRAYGCVPDSQVWTPKNGTLTLPNWSFTNIYDTESGTEMGLTDIASLRKPEYLVITLGANGVSFLDEDAFKETYKAMVEAIQGASPDTRIVLDSIFPVAASYGQNSNINNTAINQANGWILQLAEDMGLRFLDTNAYLKDATGYLPEEWQSGDGLHLTPAAYSIVLNCVRTHAYK